VPRSITRDDEAGGCVRTISVSAVVAAALAGLPYAVATPGREVAARTLVVTSYEYAFQAPERVAAGAITVRLVNRGKMGTKWPFCGSTMPSRSRTTCSAWSGWSRSGSR
jgi:hypothetical protein